MGGSLHAIPFMQREIQDASYRCQIEIEAKDRIVVGVNDFVAEEAPASNLFRVDPVVGEALVRRLSALRAARDRDRVPACLDRLESAARGRANLVPLILDAIVASATLGEICHRLRGAFGVHRPAVTF